MKDINMEAVHTLPPAEATTLKQVAHSQSNALHDVVALLSALADRIDAATPSTKVDAAASESMHYTMRLAQMAEERTRAVINAFDPYI